VYIWHFNTAGGGNNVDDCKVGWSKRTAAERMRESGGQAQTQRADATMLGFHRVANAEAVETAFFARHAAQRFQNVNVRAHMNGFTEWYRGGAPNGHTTCITWLQASIAAAGGGAGTGAPFRSPFYVSVLSTHNVVPCLPYARMGLRVALRQHESQRLQDGYQPQADRSDSNE